jgi:hypothetical protein
MTRHPGIVPEDYRNGASISPLVRAAIALGLGALERRTGNALEHARRRFGDDRSVELVLRAATTPTALSNSPALARIAVAYLEALTPQSAGADLLARGIVLNFDGAASISAPSLAVPNASFVAEGAPIPVQQSTASAATLAPHKLAVIMSLTGEMLRSSNAETMIRAVMVEACGPALDAVLFDANAAGPDRPAGLRYNIPALTPAGAGEKAQAIVDDLQALALAIAPVAGNNQIVLIGSADAMVAVRLRLPSPVEWATLTSAALPARTVIAVAVNAIVSAIEGAPAVDASVVAEFHRETSPAPIVTAAGTVASPVGSVYQTDEIALRLRWPISWALRSSGALAWMQNVNW